MNHPDPSAGAPTFAEFGVGHDLVRVLQRRGITTAFPIQAVSLPDSLAGRDLLGQGRTGSGKTVAFALPLAQRLAQDGRRRWPGRPRALILVPTRELAIQVAETMDALGAAVGLKTMTILGGVRYSSQTRRLERGVDIVIATPGRLEDLLTQGVLTLRDVSAVVVDEADLMADMGFLPPVTRILEQVPPGQRMLFSATLDGDVQVLVDRFLRDPLVHTVDEEKSNAGLSHHLFLVSHENKREVLTELVTGAGRTLLFVRTKTFAEKLAAELTQAGIPAGALHGNLRQGARQRNLASFSDGTVSVLVATDIAARGIHVDDIGLVVHVDPPTDPKAFLHRSGRTARAGAEGAVVTLATRNQNKTVRLLMAQAQIKPTQHVVAPGAEVISEVRAPRVVSRASGPSMFEPDPEDVVLDDEPAPRFPRQQAERSGDRGQRRTAGPREGHHAPGPRPDRDHRKPAWREVGAGDRQALRRADAWAAFEEGSRDDERPARRDDARPARRDERGTDRTARQERWARDERPAQGRWGRDERPRDDRGARGERNEPPRTQADPWGRRSAAAAAAASGRRSATGPAGVRAKASKPSRGKSRVKAKTVRHKRKS